MSETLADLIVQRIHKQPNQRITFAQFMDYVLYEPRYGYYSAQRTQIGKSGDFYTSPHVGPDFGELLAEQLVEMGQVLGLTHFTAVEMGAGQGLLARDILVYLERVHPEFYQNLDYAIVERSPALTRQQQQQLVGQPVRWLGTDWGTVTGCFFANELVDAFPVHRFQIQDGRLQEIYVTVGDGFTEVLGEPSTPRLAEYFALIGVELDSYPTGYQSEVNLAALDWLDQVAAHLARGYLLTIDYGYAAPRYYHPGRTTGTLLCYHQHTTNSNPYQYLGEQDLTAHVDFTALERYGKQCGLKKLGFTQQGLFLMALGLAERLADLRDDATLSLNQGLQRHQAIHRLMDPTGLGRFGVLLQSKNLTPTEQATVLKGWQVPPLN
ncbi:class I SAM-dependent methyltransferase [Candidatus Cyanaurora vandensis]|uniref:class I SAM-dependent methyltransferase n=1 Tax=Candidatus Cyanaurora vandensis TaxID=2714958 RepID=UPI00257D819E|nr:SAM-dependent methyltransferase [Candidatus Cyanaurora vandensis]